MQVKVATRRKENGKADSEEQQIRQTCDKVQRTVKDAARVEAIAAASWPIIMATVCLYAFLSYWSVIWMSQCHWTWSVSSVPSLSYSTLHCLLYHCCLQCDTTKCVLALSLHIDHCLCLCLGLRPLPSIRVCGNYKLTCLLTIKSMSARVLYFSFLLAAFSGLSPGRAPPPGRLRLRQTETRCIYK